MIYILNMVRIISNPLASSLIHTPHFPSAPYSPTYVSFTGYSYSTLLMPQGLPPNPSKLRHITMYPFTTPPI